MGQLSRWGVWPLAGLVGIALGAAAIGPAAAQTPLAGFVPFVGISLTDEFQTFDDNVLYNFALPEDSLSGSPVSESGGYHYELALLDTGAATHILTPSADEAYDLSGNGFSGTGVQIIGGATGEQLLSINNPMGVFAAGLGDRTAQGATLELDESVLRGQSSIATLSGPSTWTLPNILGLPMAAHHSITIRNDQPQVFQHQIDGETRTVRTPQVEFGELGTAGAGAGQGGADILRRAPLKLRSGIGFIQGPFYIGDPLGILSGGAHLNPQSPTVVENGGLFIDIDMLNSGEQGIDDKEFLFDTGASLTVISSQNAVRLGFDPLLDTPDFVLQVEGSGGVSSGVPGFYVEELRIDTIGGGFTAHNVPVAVLDVTNPNDPGNVVDGILGMNVFEGRNLVIDANPSTGAGGATPSLYISDSVIGETDWANNGSTGLWGQANSWQGAAVPGDLDHARVIGSGGARSALVTADALVNRVTVGAESGTMTVEIAVNQTLTVVGETTIDEGGVVFLSGGRLDGLELTVGDGGVLRGEGELFLGTASVRSPVRNLGGRIEVGSDVIDAIPTGTLAIDGDLSNTADGVIAFELAGVAPGSGHDQLTVDRFAFLDGELEVELIPGYTPQTGDTYTLLTAGEDLIGEFSRLDLPGGYLWGVEYNAMSVVLEYLGVGLAGDFNADGSVNAADYTVWRDGLGTTYTQADYSTWANNYGATAPAASAAVPEPSACLLLVLAAFLAPARRAG